MLTITCNHGRWGSPAPFEYRTLTEATRAARSHHEAHNCHPVIHLTAESRAAWLARRQWSA